MPTIIDLTTLAPTEGFSVQGLVGWSLSDAGDINGDGIDDFIVGVQEGSLGGSLAGQAVSGSCQPGGGTKEAQ